MSEQPIILKASGGADFLAMLPGLATGYDLTNSLVVIPFHGKRTIGVVRMDLPHTDSDHSVVSSTVASMVSTLKTCDGVVFAIYTLDDFTLARARWNALFEEVDSAFEEQGLRVRDAFLVASDGWVNFFERGAPLAGHPLSEITLSPMAARAAEVQNRASAASGTAAKLPDLDPTISGPLRAAIDDLLEFAVEHDAFGQPVPARALDQVTFIEDSLRRTDKTVSIPTLARLIALCATPAGRDQFIVQAAFGASVGRRIEKVTARLHRQQLRTGLSMDEVVALDNGTERKRALDEEAAMLTGETSRVPSHERISRAISLLRLAISNIDYDDRVGPLCALAWLNWALGRSSVASAYTTMARAIDPGYRMAHLLGHLFGSGSLPNWIFAAHDAHVRERDA